MQIPEAAPDLVKCIGGVVRSNCLYALAAATGDVRLEESCDGGNSQTLKEVLLSDVPVNSLVLNAHTMPASIIETKKHDGRKLWETISSYRRVTDYIVLSEMQGSVFALYAELKTSPRSTEHVRQLWCARAQMEHLLFLIDKFDNACMPTTPILHRFVKFTTLPLLKDTTSIGGQTTRYVNAKHVELNDLPGRAYRCFVQPSVKIKYSNLFYDFYH